MQERHWWLLFILLFAVITTTWLTFSIDSHDAQKNKLDENTLDAFAIGVHITNMDKAGQISTQLYTPALTHYAKNNSTKLAYPSLIIHVKKQPPWQITSNKGELKSGTDEVYLTDHVKLYQAKGAANEEVTLQTETLTVFPEKKTVMTTNPITLSSNSTHISSTGMQANLKEGTLELKANARGQYEIPAN